MSKIYCSIDNCHYWNQGNQCEASEIMVTSDQFANQTPDNLDAPQHTQFPQIKASSCEETCCKTFVPHGSGQTGVDGVTRKL